MVRTQTCLNYLSGLVTYLAMLQGVYIAPGQKWYCHVSATVNSICFLCSTLLILSMTFDRFYSIIRPHKAASFNTVKRAKLTVSCVVLFSVIYNLPHLLVSDNVNWECLTYTTRMGKVFAEAYYWLSFLVQFAFPFVLLLTMNTVIIHKIRRRSLFKREGIPSENSNQHEHFKTENSELQMFAILLLVTFAFMLLTTPAYSFFFYMIIMDISKSPSHFARYYLFYNCAQKMQFTNHGINFFLYVISGQKFRTDLKNLFLKLITFRGNCTTTSSHSASQ